MENINKNQVFYLTLAIVLPTLILGAAASLAEHGKQNGWMSIIFSGVSIGIVHYFLLKLSFQFSSDSLVTDCYKLFGKILGTIIILWQFSVVFYDSAFILYEIVYYINFVMPEINNSIIYITMSILAFYIAYSGMEVLVRISKISMIIVIIMVILVVIFIIHDNSLFNLDYLRPLIINPKIIFKGSIFPSNWFLLVPSLLILFKIYYKDKNNIIKYSLLANLTIQILVIILFVLSIVLFGEKLVSQYTFPFYDISLLVVRGMEIILFSTWIIGAVVKLAVFYFATNKLLSDLLNIKDEKLLIIPVTILIVSFSLFQFDSLLLDSIIGYVIIAEVMLFYLPIQLVLIIGYLIKLKKN